MARSFTAVLKVSIHSLEMIYFTNKVQWGCGCDLKGKHTWRKRWTN